ncbi:hypothetical protein OESDEN_22734 [Oesophagostomum dentatum]|uniref:CUB domain-containing protein n=1 Tax=Oesophagostomum dentatum TaxID=61180 RepID=A0A0B1S1B0_OESDE|nr:hypothetical protein OESDEN_22734 [Oesophagostomum dentatum]
MEKICREAGNAIVCQNGGFPHPRNCSRCLCPGGYGGDDCTQRPDNGCGKEVKATSNWQKIKLVFANDQKEYLDGYRKCTYWITSPKNTRIEVEFYSNHFGLEEDSCASAGVEIKTNKDQTLTGYRCLIVIFFYSGCVS